MAPPHQRLNTLQRRWSNADGEKVGLWVSFGILTAFIFFTLLLGTLNIHLGKPIAKLRVLEDEKAVRENRVETLTQEADDLRGQIARKTEENETAVRTRVNAERTYTTQQQLVQQQNDRIADLGRERDEKAEELRQRAAELAASRLFGTERARESDNLKNTLREVEAEKTRLDRECDRLRLQLNFATEQMARHRSCNLEFE